MIVKHARYDIVASVGFLQVCAGHKTKCESLIHAMREVYEEQSAEAVLLVDASNAFSSVNGNVFLHNVEIICPSIVRYVKNCYSLSSHFIIIGGGEIQSIKRTTQGDPAAMAIYTIAFVPMILMLVEISLQGNYNTFTAAYTDDLTSAGPIDHIKKWYEELCSRGPKFAF